MLKSLSKDGSQALTNAERRTPNAERRTPGPPRARKADQTGTTIRYR